MHWTVVSIADILQRNLLLKISGNFFVCLLLQAVLDYCITNCWNTCQIPQNSKIINKENIHITPHTYWRWFFSERAMFFQISKSREKKIFQKTILSLKFKFLANNSKVLLAEKLNFKLRIVFWNISFFEIWRSEKRIALSEKKKHL